MAWDKHDLKEYDFELSKEGYITFLPRQDILMATFAVYGKKTAETVRVELTYTGDENDEEEIIIVNGELFDIWRKPEKSKWEPDTETLNFNEKKYTLHREDDRKKERNIAPALYHYQDAFKALPGSVQAAIQPFYEGDKLSKEQVLERCLDDAEHVFMHGLYRAHVHGLGRWAKPEDVERLECQIKTWERQQLLRSA